MIAFRDKTPPKNKYGKFFLASEAPGDIQNIAAPTADAYSPSANTRVINITPGGRTRRLVFNDPDDPTPAEASPLPGDPTSDPTAPRVSDASANTGLGIPDPNGPVPSDPRPIEDMDGDPGSPDTPAPEEGGDGPVTDDGGDALNFGDDEGDAPIGDATTADEEDGEPAAPQQEQPKNGYGIEVDSTRRFALFEEFLALDAAIDGYIEKLDNILSDDAIQNHSVMDAKKKLSRTRELIHDYMLLKFESSPYDNSFFFYQLMKTVVLRVFSNLERAKKIILKTKEKEGQNNKSKAKNLNI